MGKDAANRLLRDTELRKCENMNSGTFIAAKL